MRAFERQSLTKQLMDVIIANITSGDLPVGEKLPPEAELAETLHVSRNTLREALKTLDTFGIIESLHGQGTFVSAHAMQRIPNIEILKLLSADHDVQSHLDARLVIEPACQTGSRAANRGGHRPHRAQHRYLSGQQPQH